MLELLPPKDVSEVTSSAPLTLNTISRLLRDAHDIAHTLEYVPLDETLTYAYKQALLSITSRVAAELRSMI